jgi:hypothetical protein
MSAVPPDLVQEFVVSMDEAISCTFATIQQSQVPEDSTHTPPVGAGGAGLIFLLAAHAEGSYIGAFFRITGPLQQRLNAMGGITNRELAARGPPQPGREQGHQPVGSHRVNGP